MSRTLTAFGLSFAAAALAVTAAPSAAEAANGPNLKLTVAPPAAANVYSMGRYDLTVANIGNRDATNVRVVINLPSSQTSPQVYVMGTLGAQTAGCTVSGLVMTCSIVRIRANRSAPLFFEIALPLSTSSLAMPVAASSSPADLNPLNNTGTINPVLNTFATDIQAAIVDNAGPITVDHEHCTGQGLVSFFQCTLFPSSLSAHQAVFHDDHSITFFEPGYSGSWSQNVALNQLSFTYFDDLGDPVADFVGYGVDGTNCFEGITQFYPASAYNSAYSVCLQ